MLRFIAKRILWMIPLLLGVTLIVFLITSERNVSFEFQVSYFSCLFCDSLLQILDAGRFRIVLFQPGVQFFGVHRSEFEEVETPAFHSGPALERLADVPDGFGRPGGQRNDLREELDDAGTVLIDRLGEVGDLARDGFRALGGAIGVAHEAAENGLEVRHRLLNRRLHLREFLVDFPG